MKVKCLIVKIVGVGVGVLGSRVGRLGLGWQVGVGLAGWGFGLCGHNFY